MDIKRSVGLVGVSIQISCGRGEITLDIEWEKRAHPGVIPNLAEQLLSVLAQVLQVDKCRFYALVFLGHSGHVAERAAIDIVDADDVSARPKRLEHGCRCRRA